MALGRPGLPPQGPDLPVDAGPLRLRLPSAECAQEVAVLPELMSLEQINGVVGQDRLHQVSQTTLGLRPSKKR